EATTGEGIVVGQAALTITVTIGDPIEELLRLWRSAFISCSVSRHRAGSLARGGVAPQNLGRDRLARVRRPMKEARRRLLRTRHDARPLATAATPIGDSGRDCDDAVLDLLVDRL